ncbi:hypothetical protein J5N97_002908 [Dioscorea zingiberensis]|uniref:Uncharacterized protein n=1 Tax=Dioscorea zingiberensis TaxID=325984 RepID=A0A9D5D579_9LILI|nr:hypothetical protein J5N97_002908 [Dioscorea zingiberensis]
MSIAAAKQAAWKCRSLHLNRMLLRLLHLPWRFLFIMKGGDALGVFASHFFILILRQIYWKLREFLQRPQQS